jgi:ankyrin repeat protein
MRRTSWCLALALLAIAPGVGSAANQCTVSDGVVGVPDGPAKYLGIGPVGLAAPQVRVTTIHKHAGSTVSASTQGLPNPQLNSPRSQPRFAPKPARPEPKNDQERLFNAVYDGDLAAVLRLLRSRAVDVNAPERSDLRSSLIDSAAGGAQPLIVRALIEHGAQVRGPVATIDVRPIAVAILNLKVTLQLHGTPGAFAWRPERSPQDFEATIRELLNAGADADGMLDPTHPDCALGVLLTMPRFDGDMRIARMLLDHGAQIGASAPGGSPLAMAIANGRDDFVDLALSAPHPDASALDAALAPAVGRYDATLVSRLLEAGANPDARDSYGRPLLCETVMQGETSRSLALLLLQHGARAAVDCVGGPPLNYAIQDHELALRLLEHGADPSRADLNGATALNLVPDTDHELIDVLLKHDAQLGQPFSDRRVMGIGDAVGTTVAPTLRAILHHQDYLATQLLRRDGLQGDTACTASLYAASVGTEGTLAELLHRGASPNSMTQKGITALMIAAHHGDVDAVRILLAQPQIKVDQATPTVFNSAAIIGYSEDPPPLRTGHRTALMYAAAAGHAEICNLLIQHGAKTREKDAEGKTALDYAKEPATRDALQH